LPQPVHVIHSGRFRFVAPLEIARFSAASILRSRETQSLQ